MAASAEPESPNLGQDFSYKTSKPLSLGAAALGLRRRQVGPDLASDPLSERSPAPPACPREPPPRVTKAPTGRQSPTCPPTPPMPGTRSRRAHSDAHRKRKPGRGLKPAHPSVHWSAARSPQCADAARRACRTRFRGEVCWGSRVDGCWVGPRVSPAAGVSRPPSSSPTEAAVPHQPRRTSFGFTVPALLEAKS